MLANKFKPVITAFLMLAASPLAQAFTYSDTQLLLIFRKDNYPDVEFNLGSVSNYLGRTRGTVLTVNNWNSSLVTSNFDGDLTGVQFVLLATHANTDAGYADPDHAWMTDGSALNVPTDVTFSKMSLLYAKINAIGNKAQTYTGTNSSSVYAVASGDASSYTFLASAGGTLDVANLGGDSPFPVEAEIPGTNRFFDIKVSTRTPKPAATQIGSFGIDDQGVLRFTAGAPIVLTAPTGVVLAKSATGVTATFNTTSGVNYRLVYCDALTDSITWTPLTTAGTVAGDGTSKQLQDSSNNTQRYYRVEVFQ